MNRIDYLGEVSAIRGKLELINRLIYQLHEEKAGILGEYSKLEEVQNEQLSKQ